MQGIRTNQRHMMIAVIGIGAVSIVLGIANLFVR